MTYAICRVIGNELPPRDWPGAKLDSLEYILQHAEPTDLIWVLNHIHDPCYRDAVTNLLKQYDQPFYELRFELEHYSKLRTPRERWCYAININQARNVAIRIGTANHDFAVCLDQDCFFTLPLWRQVVAFIEEDQSTFPGRCYYGLMMKRLVDNQKVDLRTLNNHEPQLMFRRDAPFLFDPQLPFGDGDKAALLQKLGFGRPPGFAVQGNLCRVAGSVLHLRSGSAEAETDLKTRMRLRTMSINALLSNLNAECK
jgi:hypothetical protein